MTEPSDLEIASQFRDDDPVARLIVHYFYPAELTRENYRMAMAGLDSVRQYATWEDGPALCYMRLWFASLFTVIAGYRQLNLQSSEVDTLLSRADFVHSLKVFRDGTFHYQPTPTKLLRLIEHDDGEAMDWVDQLHLAFNTFFSRYRVRMTVRNLLKVETPVIDSPS